MSLSLSQKYQIVRLLGYPATVLDIGNVNYSSIIVARFVISPEVEEIALSLLDRITELDGQLKTAIFQSGIKKVDDIEFFDSKSGDNISELRAERKRLIMEIGSMLDIPCGSCCCSMGSITV